MGLVLQTIIFGNLNREQFIGTSLAFHKDSIMLAFFGFTPSLSKSLLGQDSILSGFCIL